MTWGKDNDYLGTGRTETEEAWAMKRGADPAIRHDAGNMYLSDKPKYSVY